MASQPLISFVVIAYNEAGGIARTLAAIGALDGLGEHEIIVVDDGSRDRTAEIVREIAKEDPCVRLVELGSNRGRGHARARGVAEAHGGLLATVDGDTVLPPGWLSSLLPALVDHHAAGGTPVPDGDVSYLHKRFSLRPRLVGATTTVTGSNGLYRREVFDLVGYDPALREGEDVALNHAMRRRGLSVTTVPGLVVSHEEDKPFGATLRWLFDSGRGATRQLLTYREVRGPDVAAAGFAVAAVTGAVLTTRGRRALGVAVPVAFVAAASVAHVRSRFEAPFSQWPRLAPAVAVDGALLTAYFTGRLAGLTAWRRIRRG